MPKIWIALAATTAVFSGLFGSGLFHSGVEATIAAQPSTTQLRVADNNTPDGTETQDPEQQEQQTENQQQCGNPNGCG